MLFFSTTFYMEIYQSQVTTMRFSKWRYSGVPVNRNASTRCWLVPFSHLWFSNKQVIEAILRIGLHLLNSSLVILDAPFYHLEQFLHGFARLGVPYNLNSSTLQRCPRLLLKISMCFCNYRDGYVVFVNNLNDAFGSLVDGVYPTVEVDEYCLYARFFQDQTQCTSHKFLRDSAACFQKIRRFPPLKKGG